MARVEYKAYGSWHVTTEGDCEGRTTTDLGVHVGYIDDIAFALGSKAYYTLNFETAKKLPAPEVVPPVNAVSISLDIDSGTWDMNSEQRANYFRNLFKDRRVTVQPGTYYASVTLVKDPEREKLKIKARALAKLTAEERELLGLK